MERRGGVDCGESVLWVAGYGVAAERKGPLFSEPSDPDTSVGYYDAATWLRSAERKAELESQEGSLWHAYRRLWASSRKGLPDIDVAEVGGGWKSTEGYRPGR